MHMAKYFVIPLVPGRQQEKGSIVVYEYEEYLFFIRPVHSIVYFDPVSHPKQSWSHRSPFSLACDTCEAQL